MTQAGREGQLTGVTHLYRLAPQEEIVMSNDDSLAS